MQINIDKQVNHYSGEEVHLVLEFDYDPRTMGILADFAGTNVKLIHQKNGKIHASMMKMDSEALRGWLLKYITRFKVIEPENVKNELVELLKAGIDRYE